MSDIYLVLRSRLDTVGRRFEWVDLGTDVMRAARKRKGLSYEGTARLINTAAKTYERYEKSGKVPAQMLDQVADVLELEVETAAPVRVATGEASAAGGDVAEELRVLNARLSRLEEGIEALLRGSDDPPSRQAANGE